MLPTPHRRSLAAVAVVVPLLAACQLGTAGPDAAYHDDHAAMHDAVHDDHGDASPIAGAPELEVEASAMSFSPDTLELEAGAPVNVVLRSTDILHDLVVDEG
jgi:heme/copper-type cytochrome/quinol oxidase subunit 2